MNEWLEKARAGQTLASEIGRTVGLAAQIADPAPVLRRVADVEAQRAALSKEIEELRRLQGEHNAAARITMDDVRSLLRRQFGELRSLLDDESRRQQTRATLAELIERIELDPATPTARLHYQIGSATGDKVATPTSLNLSPVRWISAPLTVAARRRSA